MFALQTWMRRALLAAFLALPLPSWADATARLDEATGAVIVSGLAPLYQELHGIFARDCQPWKLHTLLASIEAPLIVVTTNYDDLVEQAAVPRSQAVHGGLDRTFRHVQFLGQLLVHGRKLLRVYPVFSRQVMNNTHALFHFLESLWIIFQLVQVVA